MRKLTDSILYNRNLLKFICLTWFSHFALKIISLTVGWQIYTETGSPLALGLIGLIQFAPQFFLILPAGVFSPPGFKFLKGKPLKEKYAKKYMRQQ